MTPHYDLSLLIITYSYLIFVNCRGTPWKSATCALRARVCVCCWGSSSSQHVCSAAPLRRVQHGAGISNVCPACTCVCSFLLRACKASRPEPVTSLAQLHVSCSTAVAPTARLGHQGVPPNRRQRVLCSTARRTISCVRRWFVRHSAPGLSIHLSTPLV